MKVWNTVKGRKSSTARELVRATREGCLWPPHGEGLGVTLITKGQTAWRVKIKQAIRMAKSTVEVEGR